MPRPAGPPAAAEPERHRLLPWALGFLAYWLIYADASLLSMPDIGWLTALRGAGFAIWAEAALAPAVLTLVRRASWEGPRLRLVLVYGAGALLFVALSLAGMVAAFAVEVRVTDGVWRWPTPPQVLVWRGLMALLVYAALCSIGHARALARRVRDEAARAARAETLHAEARLAALRAQLNPHFILNLLHSLMGMVGRDPKTAAAAIERLGGLLQHALRVQRQEVDQVPLRDELAFVDDYLALERLRLADRLRAEVDVGPDALDAVVPAFVLQPLVENAVRHGVAPRAGGGRLSVTVRAADGVLRLRVEDDGAGPAGAADPGAAERSAADPGEGLGLRLIEERLAAIYGPAASLRAGPMPGGGFAAEVTIPRSGAPREEEP
jgi:signal transduction histidine kinase